MASPSSNIKQDLDPSVHQSAIKIFELSKTLQLKRQHCYSLKDKVDDFSLLVFESSIKIEKLLYEMNTIPVNMESYHSQVEDILLPIINVVESVSGVYKDLDELYKDLLLVLNQDTHQECSKVFISSDCIKYTIPLFDSTLEFSKFKESIGKITSELIHISHCSLKKLKSWVSMVLHHIDDIESKVEDLLHDFEIKSP